MLNFEWRRVACMIALPLFASGCAVISQTGGTLAETEQVGPARVYQDTIELSGRLSVRYQQNGKDEAVHGNFTWAQTPERTNIVLLSPLGQTLAIIEVSRTESKLIQAGQPPRVAANVDTLATEALGWPLPVSGLRNWLQGFADDEAGRPVVATARTTGSAAIKTPDGWRIDYANWQQVDMPASGNRPKRIDLERSTAQAGNVSLRIVIDNWQPR